MRKYRIVQWALGNVGRRAIIAIHANPHLELVGCYVHGAAKAGQDAGALAGIGPIGVITTVGQIAFTCTLCRAHSAQSDFVSAFSPPLELA